MATTPSTIQMRRLALHGMLLLLPVFGARGQSPVQPAGSDSLFRRARRLVSEGNGAAGRALVDSVLKRETEGARGYGDALYWRGALAETAAAAEGDYRRVIVEYPLSAYADDALLAIAELEQARGDRAGALQHLQRFVKEHPASAARGTAALAAARLAFEQRDTRTGCAMLGDARASVPATDVELHNQIDYYAPRCPSQASGANTVVAAIAAPAAPAPAVRDSSMPVSAKAVVRSRPSTSKTATSVPAPPAVKKAAVVLPTPDEAAPTTAPTPHRPLAAPAVTPHGRYTIQLAAYNTRVDAERLVAKLLSRDVRARVSGSEKPFRVRLQFFATREEALAHAAVLQRRGIIGFVTTEEPLLEGRTP